MDEWRRELSWLSDPRYLLLDLKTLQTVVVALAASLLALSPSAVWWQTMNNLAGLLRALGQVPRGAAVGNVQARVHTALSTFLPGGGGGSGGAGLLGLAPLLRRAADLVTARQDDDNCNYLDCSCVKCCAVALMLENGGDTVRSILSERDALMGLSEVAGPRLTPHAPTLLACENHSDDVHLPAQLIKARWSVASTSIY